MKSKAIVAAAFISLISLSVTAEEDAKKYSVILKTGSYSMSTSSQTILARAVKFDDSASGVFGAEFIWNSNQDVSFGGEVFVHNNDYTASGSPGEASASFIMFNARKHFMEGNFRPFVGAGIGAGSVDLSGSLNGTAGGLAIQVLAGAEYRVADSVGLYVEYKNMLSADLEDDAGESVDMTGSGVLAGVAIHF